MNVTDGHIGTGDHVWPANVPYATVVPNILVGQSIDRPPPLEDSSLRPMMRDAQSRLF